MDIFSSNTASASGVVYRHDDDKHKDYLRQSANRMRRPGLKQSGDDEEKAQLEREFLIEKAAAASAKNKFFTQLTSGLSMQQTAPVVPAKDLRLKDAGQTLVTAAAGGAADVRAAAVNAWLVAVGILPERVPHVAAMLSKECMNSPTQMHDFFAGLDARADQAQLAKDHAPLVLSEVQTVYRACAFIPE